MQVALCLLSLVLVLWSGVAQATNTHGLSSTDAELRAYFGDALSPYVVTGSCAPTVPVSGLTLPAFACQAYVQLTDGELLYVNQASAQVGPLNAGNGTYWLAIHKTTTGTVSGWTRQAQTHYLWKFAASQPANPADGWVFQMVTVVGGNITAVRALTFTLTSEACTQLGWICPHTFATAGAGTSADPWTGWDGAIDWTVSNRVYYFAPGVYAFSTPLVIAGQHVHFLGAGLTTTTLRWTGAASGAALTWGIGATAYETIESEIRDFTLVSTDTTTTGKVGIQLIDFSGSLMTRVRISDFYGGNSTGLLVRGRDTSMIRDVESFAVRPLVIGEDPVAGACYGLTPSQCGFDSSTLENLYLVGVTGGGYACVTVSDRANLTSVRFTGWQSWNLCDNGFLWEDTLSTIFAAQITISGVRHEQNTDATGWIIKITRSAGALQGINISDIYGGNSGNGIYLKDAIQGTAQIAKFIWTGGSTAGVPLFWDPGPFSTVLDLQGTLFGGSVAANAGGINPCTGAGGAPTGTHSCIKGMRLMDSNNVGPYKYLDASDNEVVFGPTAYFVNADDTVVFPEPTKTIMGQLFRFPVAGQKAATTSSVGVTIANSAGSTPFAAVLDCPTDLDPCSGTFVNAMMLVTAASADFSVQEYGLFILKPVVGPNSPANNNEFICMVCSPNMVANNPGVTGKFWAYHAEGVPQGTPEGFFGFANGLGVQVNVMAIVWVVYP